VKIITSLTELWYAVQTVVARSGYESTVADKDIRRSFRHWTGEELLELQLILLEIQMEKSQWDKKIELGRENGTGQ